jgi:hypothetical protein
MKMRTSAGPSAEAGGRRSSRLRARYRRLRGRHTDPQSPRTSRPNVIALKVRIRQSRIEVALVARRRLYVDRHEIAADRATYQTEDCIQQVPSFDVEEELPVPTCSPNLPARRRAPLLAPRTSGSA